MSYLPFTIKKGLVLFLRDAKNFLILLYCWILCFMHSRMDGEKVCVLAKSLYEIVKEYLRNSLFSFEKPPMEDFLPHTSPSSLLYGLSAAKICCCPVPHGRTEQREHLQLSYFHFPKTPVLHRIGKCKAE